MLTATPQTIAILQENQRRLDELTGSTGASPAAAPAAQVGSKNWNDHRRSIPPRDPEAPEPTDPQAMNTQQLIHAGLRESAMQKRGA
jgi:hypothetical protein